MVKPKIRTKCTENVAWLLEISVPSFDFIPRSGKLHIWDGLLVSWFMLGDGDGKGACKNWCTLIPIRNLVIKLTTNPYYRLKLVSPV